MAETCSCSSAPTLFLPCSGGSNVGQIANDVARQLATEGCGKFFCLAGIGGHVSGMIESAKASATIVAIDGCGVTCALKTLEAGGVPVSHHIVLTDWGIEKNYTLDLEQSVIRNVKDRIIAMLEADEA